MISIVIPAKDEETAIEQTIEQIKLALTDVKHEIIVVDDGSQDATVERAKSAGLKVISHPHNLGYGASLKTGIRAAQYDTIVITDADGTYPNDQIPMLLSEYNKGFDMVVGARTGQHYFESIFKAPLRLLLKFMVEYTAGRKVPDVNSGLRVFSKKKATPYFNHLSNTFSFTTSITLAYMMNNLFVKYIPIPYHKRTGSTKVHLLRDSLRTLQYIVEAITYYNPLKIFLLISGLTFVTSLLSLILAFFSKLSIFYFLGIGGMLTAINVFCIGLIAVLLRQIMVKD
jgi:glycosyltransferase involved in cell wall biosynthesis